MIGLFYQTYLLYEQYAQRNTVVNINIGRIFDENLPAITICYYPGQSFQRLASVLPDLDLDYHRYVDLMLHSNKTLEDDQESKFFNIWHKGLFGIEELVNKSFIGTIPNITIPFVNEQGQMVIELSVHGSNLTNLDKYFNYTNYHKTYIGTVRESYLVNEYPHEEWLHVSKCFTFFSWLERYWRDFKMNIDAIHVTIYYKFQWSPPSNISLFASIHSPNTLPRSIGKNLFAISNYQTVYVRYARLETHLLESPYKTDCVHYDNDKGGYHGKYKMWSDCISDCEQQACGQIVMHGVRMRKEYLEQNPQLKLGMCSVNNNERLYVGCNKVCKRECHFTNFVYEKTERHYEDSESRLGRSQKIVIEHNRLPDIVVKHHPETNLISLICNFGGLLGMWCGLSVSMFLDKITLTTINLFNSPRITNNFIFVIYNKYAKRHRVEN